MKTKLKIYLENNTKKKSKLGTKTCRPAVFTKNYLLSNLLRISLINKKKSNKKLKQAQEQFFDNKQRRRLYLNRYTYSTCIKKNAL